MSSEEVPAPEPGEGYQGPAVIAVQEQELDVSVQLRGAFQPLDGRFHWWGRIWPDDQVEAHCRAGQNVVLRVGTRTAVGRLSDLDPWGRLRITGTGRPPFD